MPPGMAGTLAFWRVPWKPGAADTEALPFADEYCKARVRTAHFNRMEMVSRRNVAFKSALFDCLGRAE